MASVRPGFTALGQGREIDSFPVWEIGDPLSCNRTAEINRQHGGWSDLHGRDGPRQSLDTQEQPVHRANV